jgi:ABC-2 type transport system ATP-binding protein
MEESSMIETVPTSAKTILKISDLYKSYGSHAVLKGLNLEVREGELFGFIGKNGIGKSTTIDCIVGAKNFDSGSIRVDGYDIRKEALLAKKEIGYVSSEPLTYEMMTGNEYVEFVASLYDMEVNVFLANFKYLSRRLDLSDSDLNKQIKGYSHGMKQKLCLIASLIHSPKLRMLDEPTVGLDIMVFETLKQMMKEYASHGNTVFITSHNIDLVSKLCDRVAIVNDGKVAYLFDLDKEPNRRIQLEHIFMEVYGRKL